jgi:hypothetical protein
MMLIVDQRHHEVCFNSVTGRCMLRLFQRIVVGDGEMAKGIYTQLISFLKGVSAETRDRAIEQAIVKTDKLLPQGTRKDFAIAAHRSDFWTATRIADRLKVEHSVDILDFVTGETFDFDSFAEQATCLIILWSEAANRAPIFRQKVTVAAERLSTDRTFGVMVGPVRNLSLPKTLSN